MEIRPRRAETHPILAGVMMDEAILLPSSGAARAARLLDARVYRQIRCIDQQMTDGSINTQSLLERAANLAARGNTGLEYQTGKTAGRRR